MTALSPLEMAAASMVAAQISPNESAALIAQLETAKVTLREFTGVGFFTEVAVDRTLARAEVTESPGGWVRSLVGPEKYPLEFMLYVKDGFAEMIEAYSFFDGYGDLDLLTCDFTLPEAVIPTRLPLS